MGQDPRHPTGKKSDRPPGKDRDAVGDAALTEQSEEAPNQGDANKVDRSGTPGRDYDI